MQNALHVTGKILWIERLSRFGIRNRKLTVKKKLGLYYLWLLGWRAFNRDELSIYRKGIEI